MAALIKIKRSSVSGNPAALAGGELAYSALADNGANGGDRLYVGMGTETDGNAANHVVIGGKYFTDLVNAATAANTVSTIVKRDASGNFTATTVTAELAGNASTVTNGIYSTGIGTVTNTMLAGSIANAKLTNSKVTIGSTEITLGDIQTTLAGLSSVTSTSFTGGLTGNASTATVAGTLATGRTIALTGDVTYTSTAFDGSANVTATATLAASGVTAGQYGAASLTPVITVDAKGRVTAIETVATSGSVGAAALTISDGTVTDNVMSGTDTLVFASGTGVTTTVTNNQVSFAIGQAVGTSSNVTFGDVTVSGDLIINGTTTSINSTTLSVTDLNITVAKGAVNATAANGAGLTVEGPVTPATLLYVGATDSWALNKPLAVSVVTGDLVGNAGTATKLVSARTIGITGDITYSSGTFDGSANVTAAATLATVNSNVGSFGSSTSVPNVTVNAKGLITAVSANAIPTATSSVLGLASFGTGFTVTEGNVVITTVDSGTY